MVPSFDSLGTVSYSHSILTIALSCIISETKRGRKSRFFIPPAFDPPPPPPPPPLSRVDRIPACDMTDGQTKGRLAIAQSALCTASRGKTSDKIVRQANRQQTFSVHSRGMFVFIKINFNKIILDNSEPNSPLST